MGSSWRVQDTGPVTASGNSFIAREKPAGSTKLNAIWLEGDGLQGGAADAADAADAAQYFELTVDSGSGVWFGLGQEAHFGAGWKCKGFMFGGNLSDGGALMRQAFGPAPGAGDVVGMRCEVAGSPPTLSVHYSVNGVGLGLAFEVELEGEAASRPLFPVASLSTGPAQVSLRRATVPPAGALERPVAGARTTLGGRWMAPAAEVLDGAAADLPAVGFSVDASIWHLGASVANSMGVQLAKAAPHKSAGPPSMTMMMPPPPLQALERAVQKLLTNVEDVQLVDGNMLITHSGGDSLACAPLDPSQAPVTKSEINWLRPRPAGNAAGAGAAPLPAQPPTLL